MPNGDVTNLFDNHCNGAMIIELDPASSSLASHSASSGVYHLLERFLVTPQDCIRRHGPPFPYQDTLGRKFQHLGQDLLTCVSDC